MIKLKIFTYSIACRTAFASFVINTSAVLPSRPLCTEVWSLNCAVPTNLDILPRNVFRYNKGRPSVEKYQHRYLTGLMSLLPFNLICKDYLVSKFSGVFPFRFISSRNHQSELHYWLLDFFADVDECSSSIPVCDPNANCQNTEGSFRCQCMPGFSGDRKSCTGKVF